MNEKSYELSLLKSLTSHWWGLENDGFGHFRWTWETSAIRVDNSRIIALDIAVEVSPINPTDISIVVGDNTQLFQLSAGKHILHVDVISPSDIQIVGQTFIPHKINSSAIDTRELSIQIRSISVHYVDGSTSYFDISELPFLCPSTKLDEVRNKLESSIRVPPTDYSPKPFTISTSTKGGIILYLDKPYPRLLRNLAEFPASKKFEIVSFTDNASVTADIIVPPFDPTRKMKYDYSNMAVMTGARIAQERGWDYHMWIEWDCYFGKEYWFDILWSELMGWPYEPIMGGTPIVSQSQLGGNLQMMVQEYMAAYIKSSGVAMSFVYGYPFFLAVNGAMSFYKTQKAVEYLSLPRRTRLIASDIIMGLRMFDEFGEDVFKHNAWLPSLYSGWGEQIYTESQRKEMVDTGFKVAMHQYKHL